MLASRSSIFGKLSLGFAVSGIMLLVFHPMLVLIFGPFNSDLYAPVFFVLVILTLISGILGWRSMYGKTVLIFLAVHALGLTLLSSDCFWTQPNPRIPTQAILRSLHDAVMQYKTKTGCYPKTLADKDVLALLDFADVDTPTDYWGNEFVYTLTPNKERPFDIVSYGADGKEGGMEDSVDLSSWDAMARGVYKHHADGKSRHDSANTP